jgi:uncharacterized membrane protein YeaQ/YmgE (transglycosylase-associated protein family)
VWSHTYSCLVDLVWWIVVGLIAGLFARWIVKDDRSGCLYTIGVGILGALIGGALMRASGLQNDNVEFGASLITATLGAILLLLVLQALGGRTRRRSRSRRR